MIAYTFYMTDARVRREAEALVERGDLVDFICLREPESAKRESCQGVTLYEMPAAKYQGDSTIGYITRYLIFFLQAFGVVSRLYLKRRYDVIQVHTMPDFLVYAALIPKLFGARVILDVHDLMPELFVCKFRSGPKHLVVRCLTLIERLSIRFADAAIAVHEPHRDVLVAHGSSANHLSVVLNVADPRIFHRRDTVPRNDGVFRLVYHGTVARRHGLDVALKAIKTVRNDIPNLEFLVIGRGDDWERIQSLATEMGIDDCVRFMNAVPADQLPEHLHQADVGLVPILYDAFTRYMLPVKLMEYVALGIPCIVSETETIRAYFDEHMVCFSPPGNVQELAVHIRRLYREPDERKRLADRAESFAHAHHWDSEKRRYFGVIDALCAKPDSTQVMEERGVRNG